MNDSKVKIIQLVKVWESTNLFNKKYIDKWKYHFYKINQGNKDTSKNFN